MCLFNINNSEIFIKNSQWQCRCCWLPKYIHKVYQ